MTDLAKLAWPDVAALLEKGCGAILPVGATEAHGPHLPLDTDVTIAQGMARRAARQLTDMGRPFVVLPPVVYGVAAWAEGFAGTFSLPAEVASAHLAAVLEAAARGGFRPLALANGHLDPAHLATLRAACEQVATRTGVEVVFPDVTRRRLAERLTEEFRSGACHAGRYESSLVLADDPAAVKDDVRRRLAPVPASLVDAIREGKTRFEEAGGTQAYFGWPAEASAEEGRVTFAILGQLLVEALQAAES